MLRLLSLFMEIMTIRRRRPSVIVRYLKWYDGVYRETLTFWDINEWERVVKKTDLQAPDIPVGTYFVR